MVIGLLIAIATTMISVLDFPGWARAIVIPCVAIIIIVVLVDNGGVQNFLLRIKRTYEDKAR